MNERSKRLMVMSALMALSDGGLSIDSRDGDLKRWEAHIEGRQIMRERRRSTREKSELAELVERVDRRPVESPAVLLQPMHESKRARRRRNGKKKGKA